MFHSQFCYGCHIIQLKETYGLRLNTINITCLPTSYDVVLKTICLELTVIRTDVMYNYHIAGLIISLFICNSIKLIAILSHVVKYDPMITKVLKYL